jgi:hypothetical protein
MLAGGELVAFDVGPDDIVYLVVALEPLDYRIDAGRGSFAKTVPERPQSYRVLGLAGANVVLDVVVRGERFNIHYVQPLGNELLLVCGRSVYRASDDFDLNGRVYSRAGKFVREMLLGDGIQSVQTTPGSVIWTSYFDEGVFGNYGWRNPVGGYGLVAWDAAGSKTYEFKRTGGLDSISDCYALNVESEESVWFCYYMDFPLVRLHRGNVASVWNMPVKGSHAFAVFAGHALFQGGYDDHDTFHLLDLGRGTKARPLAKFGLRDADGRQLAARSVIGRGSAIHFIDDNKLYRLDVQTAIDATR